MIHAADIVAVCWASERHVIAGILGAMSVTYTGSIWHDHSTGGGDIVCTGPFTLEQIQGVTRAP